MMDTMAEAMASTFRRSVPEITHSLQQHPEQLKQLITFFFRTREYRKLHEILKAFLKAGSVIDDTCFQCYSSSVCDLTIASACETWSWFLSFKLTPPLIHLFRVFLQHISISGDSLVPGSRTVFADHLKQTEDLIEKQLQEGTYRVDWMTLCYALGHVKLLFMTHGPETMIKLKKKVKWYDMSLVLSISYDWRSFFTESLMSSNAPEKEIAFRLLMLKLKSCDAVCTFTDSRQVRDSGQQLVHHLPILPDIGSCLLLDESAIDCLIQSAADCPEDVLFLTHALVKQMQTKGNQNLVKVNETTVMGSAAFQSSVIGSVIAELLQVTSAASDLHRILTLLSSATEWIQFQYSLPSEDNKCWNAIREASQIMMQSKDSSSSSGKLFIVSSSRIGLILNSMRNLVFLPVLLPLNQSRCMMLHLMLLFWWSRDKMRGSLIDALIQMLASSRSIWLFDFLPPSFILMNIPEQRTPQVDTLVRAILCRVLKHENLVTDFNDNIVNQKNLGAEAAQCLHRDLLQAYLESKENSHVCRADIVTQVVEAAISKVLKGLRRAESEDSERFVKSPEHLHSLSLLLQLLHPENGNKKIVALVKKVLRNIFSNEEILNNDEAKFLQLVCEKRQRLDAILSEEFLSELCNKVFGHSRPAAGQDALSSPDCSDVREIILRSSAKRFKSDNGCSVKSAAFHANLIRSMLDSCNERECTSLCSDWRRRFAESPIDKSVVLIKSLTLWANHVAPAAASEAEHQRLCHDAAEAAAELMFDLTNRLRNGVGEGGEVDVDLIMSILNLTQALMRAPFGKLLPLNAVLNVTAFALHEIRKLVDPAAAAAVDRVTDFAGILLAAQAVLFQAIVCQKIAVITVMPYFNILTSRLFRMCLSLCDEQLLNTCCPETVTQAERCAQSVTTLITSLCNICDFHPFAAELLVMYVHYVHSNIIHHRIHPILLSAVNCLFSVIGSKHQHTLERQHVRLNQAGKDMLKQFTANYEQFYRFRGYV